MNFEKFKLLMWKNYHLRRHHWLVTLIEFALPILIAYAMMSMTREFTKSFNTAQQPENIHSPISYSKKTSSIGLNTLGVELYYAPSVPVIDQFMKQMEDDVQSMKGLANEAELETTMRDKSRWDVFGIFFQDITSNESLPDGLSYVIRNNDEWNTRSFYPQIETSSGQYFDPYFFNRFCAVQLLINDYFVKMKTNQSDPFKQVEFERFPYPPYTSDNSPRSWVSLGVGFIVVFVILITSIPLIRDIIEEKDSGVKELMKIAGLDEWLMWLGWFVHALIVSLISLTILTFILTYPFEGSGSEALHFVQFTVLWSILILYCVANISFCFMFSAIFQKTSSASSIFTLCFLGLLTGINWMMNNVADNPALRLITFTPVGAFILAFSRIRYYEMHGVEFTWSSVFVSENDQNSVSLLFCLLMLVVDTCLYCFLAYYINAINPGKFGARKSPFFIFKGLFSYFSKNDNQPLQNLTDSDSKFFEPPPQNAESTIQIKNLHKNYGKVYAVRGVNMNIYQGEMTALLGHNGAGKTTTMSIMTGLSSPSAGSIRFRGMDIFENMDKFRQNLGMCPQENRTLPYLTVLQHLLFFGRLKGISQEDALAEANEYLTMMEMQSKKNCLARQLSGGMMRKLCLSIALMGKAEVLILDEPTSGMDVQSRRKLWDLLLDLRGQRTVIFTTHYMEEADALGDRIAIMNHGVIVCHGTPIFLKKAYGTGYELTITKDGGDSAAIDNVIKAALPDASRELDTPTETVYKLPLTETSKFPTLFKNLEAEKLRLGIRNLGVAATTMEHVFLKVGGVSIYDAESANHKTVTDSNSGTSHLRYVKGASLYLQQIKAIFAKKCLYTSRNLYTIFNRIILPSLVGIFVLSGRSKIGDELSPEPALDLSMDSYPSSIVVLKNNVPDSSFAKHLPGYVAEEGGLLVDAHISPIEKDLLQYGSNILKYNRDYISAFEVNSTGIKVLSNPPLIHSFPITITTYTNVLLRSITNDSRFQINTINHPVRRSRGVDSHNSCGIDNKLAIVFYLTWFIAVPFYTVDLTAYFAAFVNMERIDGFQHVQTMSHVFPLVYWFATLLFDVVFFLFLTLLRVGIYKIIDNSSFLSLDTSLGVFALIIILYGISGLLFIYVTGYLSSSKEGSYTLLFIFNSICCIIVWVIFAINAEKAYKEFTFFYRMLFYFTKGVIYIVPTLNFMLIFIKFMIIFQINAECSYCSNAIAKENCEKAQKIKSYLEFASDENENGLLLELIFLIFDIVLYATLLSVINIGYVRYWFRDLRNHLFGTFSTNPDNGDDDVKKEYEEVQKYKEDISDYVLLTKRERDAIYGKLSMEMSEKIPLRERNKASLLVDGLRKNYMSWFKPLTAVSDVNFIVQAGECFGLLGVNGAGKSTTFKILTAEIVPTLGDASIENIKLSANKMQYLSMAGYCPQTNCFIEELTGREMLSMIATMRGVFQNEIKLLVDKWIKIIGLEEFQNRRCGTYSGGNKRKLCTAMSLIGDPRVVFLDEPTSGVDPVSRRNLYDVMAQSKEAGQAVILTSHSMEECETLCDRLTIMVSGVMKCIGTTQHLKKQYAQGFSIMIKINDSSEFDEEKAALKNTMLETFTEEYCILKDEHRGLLYYQIKDTSIPWWSLFEKMETLKQRYARLVEDYVLTDTTLEEVFISFAKKNADTKSKK